MQYYESADIAIKATKEKLYNLGQVVNSSRWQSIDVSQGMWELFGHSFGFKMPQSISQMQLDINPNLPWADDHFEERVGRLPLNPPPSNEWWPFAQKNNKKFYLIQKKVMISGEQLTDARPGFDQDGSSAVMFTLTTAGGKKFGKITGKNIGKAFAIVLDKKVISAPIIQGQIFSNGQITGNFTVQEANDLALVLRAGALPVPLNILEERTVGPGLGNDSIEAGKFASILAIIAVIIFMIITYGIFGIIANIALVMNMTLIIAILSLLQATLTLPGIAGIVLTIGMAVDANVLIFERIREEFKIRKNKFDSVDEGFKKAVSTIIDANLTTFIAAFALFVFGSGPIKGFSVTLMIGLVTSMYTAIVLTRFLIIKYISRG